MSSARVPLYIIVIKHSSHWTQASVLRFSCSVLSTPSANSTNRADFALTQGLQKPSEARHPPYAPSELYKLSSDNGWSIDDIAQFCFNARLNAHLHDYSFLHTNSLHPQYELSPHHRCIAHSDGMRDIRDAVSVTACHLLIYRQSTALIYTVILGRRNESLEWLRCPVFSYETAWNSREPLQAQNINVDVVLSRHVQQILCADNDLINDVKALIQKHIALKHIIDFDYRQRGINPGPHYFVDVQTSRIWDTSISLHRTQCRAQLLSHYHIYSAFLTLYFFNAAPEPYQSHYQQTGIMGTLPREQPSTPRWPPGPSTYLSTPHQQLGSISSPSTPHQPPGSSPSLLSPPYHQIMSTGSGLRATPSVGLRTSITTLWWIMPALSTLLRAYPR